MAFDQNKYIEEWRKKNVDSLLVRFPKGKKEILQRLANENNTSVNKIFVNAVEEKYHIDLSNHDNQNKLQK